MSEHLHQIIYKHVYRALPVGAFTDEFLFRELFAATKAAADEIASPIADILSEIEGLTVNLRSGGPDPMDLQGLSDGLERACDLATQAGNLLAVCETTPALSVKNGGPANG